MTRTRPSLVRILACAALVCTAVVAIGAAPAHADSRVSVTNDRGGDQADLTYRTELTVRGSGFQVVQGGFGGVYVMFGWVKDPRGGSWKPSRGGLTGQDYRYIPDAEDAADNQGYLRYVAFPGSSTATEAADVLSPSGGFSLRLTVPGPVFQSVDRDGQVAEVDCREVTCGIITIGAHGVKSPANETFTPVTFGTVYDTAPQTDPHEPDRAAEPSEAPVDPAQETQDGSAEAPGVTDEPGKTGPGTPSGKAGLTVDRATAVQGRALAFSARGFTPGEQVTAVLDDGVAGLGPLTAGASGEVAGVLQLPPDLTVGTHELRITGAASGTEVSELFPVAAGDTIAPTEGRDGSGGAATPDVASTDDGTWFLVIAALVFAAAAGGFAFSRLRRSGTAIAPAGAP